MKQRLTLWLLLLLGLHVRGQAQTLVPDTSNWRRDALRSIKHLCSSRFYGRGYYKQGDSLAAVYIAQQFQQAGLRPYAPIGGYLQRFSHAVITWPETPTLRLNGRKLRLGYDWLPNADCPPVDGRYRLRLAQDSAGALPSPYQQFVVMPAQPRKQAKSATLGDYAGMVQVQPKKLTHTIASDWAEKPSLQLLGQLPLKTGDELQLRIAPVRVPAYHSFNVLGHLPGQSDSLVIVCAHYDHLGQMGRLRFPGANDNASGTTMLMQLASDFVQAPKPRYSMLFIAFAGEEAGLLGSTHFVTEMAQQMGSIPLKYVLNLDLLGGGSEGLMFVNGQAHPDWMQRIETLNKQLPSPFVVIKRRPNAPNSDHYPFAQAGYPALFLYTLGDVSAYHDPEDTADKLKLAHWVRLRLLIKWLLG